MLKLVGKYYEKIGGKKYEKIGGKIMWNPPNLLRLKVMASVFFNIWENNMKQTAK